VRCVAHADAPDAVRSAPTVPCSGRPSGLGGRGSSRNCTAAGGWSCPSSAGTRQTPGGAEFTCCAAPFDAAAAVAGPYLRAGATRRGGRGGSASGRSGPARRGEPDDTPVHDDADAAARAVPLGSRQRAIGPRVGHCPHHPGCRRGSTTHSPTLTRRQVRHRLCPAKAWRSPPEPRVNQTESAAGPIVGFIATALNSHEPQRTFRGLSSPGCRLHEAHPADPSAGMPSQRRRIRRSLHWCVGPIRRSPE
jgi:hypothetical protein